MAIKTKIKKLAIGIFSAGLFFLNYSCAQAPKIDMAKEAPKQIVEKQVYKSRFDRSNYKTLDDIFKEWEERAEEKRSKEGLAEKERRKEETKPGYREVFFEELDNQLDRKSINLDEDLFFIGDLLTRRPIENFLPKSYYSSGNYLALTEDEQERIGEFSTEIFKDAGKQFIESTTAIDKIENAVKSLFAYELWTGGEKRYVRKDIPPDLAYEQLKDIQQEKEVSKLKMPSEREKKRTRVKWGVKMRFNSMTPRPAFYTKIYNPRILKKRIDKIDMELNPGEDVEFGLEKVLFETPKKNYKELSEKELKRKAYEGEPGIYWALKGGFGIDMDGSNSEVWNGKVSISRLIRMGELTQSRFEIFYKYDQNEGSSESQIGFGYRLAF